MNPPLQDFVHHQRTFSSTLIGNRSVSQRVRIARFGVSGPKYCQRACGRISWWNEWPASVAWFASMFASCLGELREAARPLQRRHHTDVLCRFPAVSDSSSGVPRKPILCLCSTHLHKATRMFAFWRRSVLSAAFITFAPTHSVIFAARLMRGVHCRNHCVAAASAKRLPDRVSGGACAATRVGKSSSPFPTAVFTPLSALFATPASPSARSWRIFFQRRAFGDTSTSWKQ